MANMIHSMAGGDLGEFLVADFAKVRFLDGESAGGVAWFIAISGIEAGDKVLVPGRLTATEPVTAIVERVDRSVDSFRAPVPIKRCKKIIKKVE